MRTGIYYLKCKPNDKYYIGSTGRTFNERFTYHRTRLNNDNHDNDYLQNAWNKYGEENFEFKVLIEIKEHYLSKAEQYWIDKWETYKRQNGYNIKRYVNRYTPTKETRDKMSRISKERYENNKEEFLSRLPEPMSGKDNPSWQGGKVELECNYCDEKYKVYKSRESYSRYCKVECRAKDKKGEDNNFTKLTNEDVKEIKWLLSNSDLTHQEISEKYPVGRTGVSHISNNVTWKNINEEKEPEF